MLRTPLLYMSQRKTVKHAIMAVPLSRRVALRFVAGDTLEDAIDTIGALNRAGIRVTLDHLGENVSDVEATKRAADSYVEALHRIAVSRVDGNVSVKLTQMGLDISYDLCQENVGRILEAASAMGNFVRIDMESHEYVDRTLQMYAELRARGYENVGVVIQSYLYRSEEDVDTLLKQGARVRLVKGAYNEPASVAYPHKRDVDANFLRLAAKLLEGGNYPAIATHDEKIIKWTKRFAAEHAVEPRRFEFQLLYGVRRDLQERLANEGYNVRAYVPYGNDWYGYLMRRIAERPANLFFVLGNLFRG
ncbi:MAG: proline dehydrogenase family protein [Chloroflexota bacterium]